MRSVFVQYSAVEQPVRSVFVQQSAVEQPVCSLFVQQSAGPGPGMESELQAEWSAARWQSELLEVGPVEFLAERELGQGRLVVEQEMGRELQQEPLTGYFVVQQTFQG